MGQTDCANSAFEIQAKENRQSKGTLRNNVTNDGVRVLPMLDFRYTVASLIWEYCYEVIMWLI